MKLSKDAIGMLRDFPDGSQIAIARDKDGKTIELKIRCKARDLQAQQVIDIEELLK